MDIVRIRRLKALLFISKRKEAKLSQEQLAELSGLRQATISKMERGLVAWSVDSEIILMETLRKYNQKEI